VEGDREGESETETESETGKDSETEDREWDREVHINHCWERLSSYKHTDIYSLNLSVSGAVFMDSAVPVWFTVKIPEWRWGT